MNQFSAVVQEVLRFLDDGVPDFWLAIEGGGYEGEFERDYSLEGCTGRRGLIHELQLHGIDVKVHYHRAFDVKAQKDSYTKVLILTK